MLESSHDGGIALLLLLSTLESVTVILALLVQQH